jgi:DNA-directed RNA polymerase specialized sigma24 family protein
MEQNFKLKDYENMLRKVCWRFVKQYGDQVEFDDLFNESVVIFYDTVERFDGHQDFALYLNNSLNGYLRYYIKKNIRVLGEIRNLQNTQALSPDVNKEGIERTTLFLLETEYSDERIQFEKVVDFYDAADSELSSFAKIALEMMINGTLESVNTRKRIGVNTLVKALDWNRARAEQVWNEIGSFFREFQCAV